MVYDHLFQDYDEGEEDWYYEDIQFMEWIEEQIEFLNKFEIALDI